ncbi:YcxB family protein [Micromonospora sp. 15K316]|uniref:YcxB family protein n=1 Tax=Micromonospora sp. 15K316 TaxID=2530376 RepID=UPI001049CA44|nr:YcxB family protein [Micromonospora sp. 15K316]TDC25995.1 YcxB family protein [Micromonospora sp. 15K316]
MTGEVQMTYGLLRRISQDAQGRWQRVMRALLLALTALAVLLATLLATLTGFDGRLLYLVLLLCAAFAVTELLPALGWLLQRRLFVEPFRYEVSTSGVDIQTASSRTQIDWSGITRIRPRRHTWLLKYGMSQIPVPRAAFSPEDQRIVDDFIVRRPEFAG